MLDYMASYDGFSAVVRGLYPNSVEKSGQDCWYVFAPSTSSIKVGGRSDCFIENV